MVTFRFRENMSKIQTICRFSDRCNFELMWLRRLLGHYKTIQVAGNLSKCLREHFRKQYVVRDPFIWSQQSKI